MSMTRRLNRTAVSAVVALSVMFGISAVASAEPVTRDTPPVLLHPCDVSNDNGLLDTPLERLCMRVWKQDAYTISSEDGDHQKIPAGPVLAVDLVNEWIDEDAGIIWLREGFEGEREMYAKRDR